jgi:hypothetical protein
VKPLALLKAVPGAADRWRPAPPDAPYDLESRDGRRVLKLAAAAQGVRDLHGHVVRLAQLLAVRPRLGRAILAVQARRLSLDRLRREWDSLGAILRPSVRDRLALVFLGDAGPWVSVEDAELRRLAEALGGGLGRTEPVPSAASAPSPRFFETFKLLLDHRLRRGGPLGVGDLVRLSGFSYPTVTEAIKRLENAKELVRRTRRLVELPAFPRRTWSEILALAGPLRRTAAFVDASGRPPRLTELLGRIEKAAPEGVALGGAIAARHWDRDFDLHGLPRLDLCLHAPEGEPDLEWIRRVDPALRPAPPAEAGVTLAVHPLRRARPGFEARKGRSLPVADPVETLLDLHEMGLRAQGEELIARLEARP